MHSYQVPAMAGIRPSDNLADVVFRRAAAEPDAVMLGKRSANGDWQDVTAAQFHAEVAALACGLIAAGIEPGDRIGLMSRTCYEWTLIDYAIWSAGGVGVPVYETSSAEQIEWILADSGARAVLAEAGVHQLVTSASARLPGLQQSWRIDELDAIASGGARVSAQQLDEHRQARAAADLATIVYTSGTTGRPKGCPLSHGNLLADVRNAVAALPEIFEQPGCRTLLFLPLAHVFARIIEIGVLEAGAVLGHWPDPATLATGLTEFRPTFLLAVPRVFEKVFESAQRQAATGPAAASVFAAATRAAIQWSEAEAVGRRPGLNLRLRHAAFDRLVYRRLRSAAGGRLRYAICGGAPLGQRLGHYFRGVGITVLEGYGLTEASGAVTVNRPKLNKIGTVGQPLPGVTIRIADDGEIQVKGQNVFAGYWCNADASSDVLDMDGWLRTGDAGALDGDGTLRVTGRQKDLIVTAGGINVAPSALEDRISADPLVSHCMVVGEGRPYIACLITLDAEALQHWLQQHGRPADTTVRDLADDPDLTAELQRAVHEANKSVSRAESIRRFRILGTDFTEAGGQLTPSDKVRRSAVAREFAAEIDALYDSTS
jgi:long-chain acyl-CoA synthetase